jgi:hypothetical protein
LCTCLPVCTILSRSSKKLTAGDDDKKKELAKLLFHNPKVLQFDGCGGPAPFSAAQYIVAFALLAGFKENGGQTWQDCRDHINDKTSEGPRGATVLMHFAEWRGEGQSLEAVTDAILNRYVIMASLSLVDALPTTWVR